MSTWLGVLQLYFFRRLYIEVTLTRQAEISENEVLLHVLMKFLP